MADDNSNTPSNEEEVAENATETTEEAEASTAENQEASTADGETAAAEADGSSAGDASPAIVTTEKQLNAWPIDKDHASAQKLLTDSGGADVDLDMLVASDTKSGRKLGLLLVILIAGGAGSFKLAQVSSAEVLQAKAEIRKAAEEAHMAEQMKRKKRYGVLRIESQPSQALILKDGEKLYAGPGGAETDAPAEGATHAADGTKPAAAAGTPPKPATPKPAEGAAAVPGADPADAAQAAGPRVGMTPINLMDLDIAETYRIKVSKPGYEDFEFAVAEHLWTKDPTTSEYKFFKMVELTPVNCEYWFFYNAGKRREMKFVNKEKGQLAGAEQKAECMHAYQAAVDQGVPVTECTCKIPPEGIEVPAPK